MEKFTFANLLEMFGDEVTERNIIYLQERINHEYREFKNKMESIVIECRAHGFPVGACTMIIPDPVEINIVDLDEDEDDEENISFDDEPVNESVNTVETKPTTDETPLEDSTSDSTPKKNKKSKPEEQA